MAEETYWTSGPPKIAAHNKPTGAIHSPVLGWHCEDRNQEKPREYTTDKMAKK